MRTRTVLLAEATFCPHSRGMAQQVRNVLWECDDRGMGPRFFIHDRDGCFSPEFDTVLKHAGVEPVKTPFRAPNANAIAERWVRSARTEGVRHLVLFGLNRLRRVVRQYKDFFNDKRPHQGIGNRVPAERDPDACPDFFKGASNSRRPPIGRVMTESKGDLYARVAAQLAALLAGERDFAANAAAAASLIIRELPDLNWAGFYVLEAGELVLGPFEGEPACTRIALGRGVCGTSAERRETVVVENVHDFPGHIACDSASNSEIVVPLIPDGRLVGVLDLDSPTVGRFDSDDRAGLEHLVGVFLENTDTSGVLGL
jgi:L-methionine (R)-S-oxide reductase